MDAERRHLHRIGPSGIGPPLTTDRGNLRRHFAARGQETGEQEAGQDPSRRPSQVLTAAGGGSVWESNPPEPPEASPSRF